MISNTPCNPNVTFESTQLIDYQLFNFPCNLKKFSQNVTFEFQLAQHKFN